MEASKQQDEQPRQSGQDDLGVSDRERFVLELEFVQSLASPGYLNWLAQNRYLDDPAFLGFLKYLKYWKQPAYSRFVIYPCCLEFLDLLQTPEFRAAIANPAYKELLHTQQFYSWQYHRTIRQREAREGRGPEAGAAAPPPPMEQGGGGSHRTAACTAPPPLEQG